MNLDRIEQVKNSKTFTQEQIIARNNLASGILAAAKKAAGYVFGGYLRDLVAEEPFSDLDIFLPTEIENRKIWQAVSSFEREIIAAGLKIRFLKKNDSYDLKSERYLIWDERSKITVDIAYVGKDANIDNPFANLDSDVNCMAASFTTGGELIICNKSIFDEEYWPYLNLGSLKQRIKDKYYIPTKLCSEKRHKKLQEKGYRIFIPPNKEIKDEDPNLDKMTNSDFFKSITDKYVEDFLYLSIEQQSFLKELISSVDKVKFKEELDSLTRHRKSVFNVSRAICHALLSNRKLEYSDFSWTDSNKVIFSFTDDAVRFDTKISKEIKFLDYLTIELNNHLPKDKAASLLLKIEQAIDKLTTKKFREILYAWLSKINQENIESFLDSCLTDGKICFDGQGNEFFNINDSQIANLLKEENKMESKAYKASNEEVKVFDVKDKPTFIQRFGKDFVEASYQTGAIKIGDATAAIILSVLKKELPEEEGLLFEKFFNHPVGKGMILFGMGNILTYAFGHEKAQRLAEKMRVQGLTNELLEIVNAVQAILLPQVQELMNSLPESVSEMKDKLSDMIETKPAKTPARIQAVEDDSEPEVVLDEEDEMLIDKLDKKVMKK